MTDPGEAAARAALDAHGDRLMAQTGAFACGLRREAAGWTIVLTVSGPPTTAPPHEVGGVAVRVEHGEAMSPL